MPQYVKSLVALGMLAMTAPASAGHLPTLLAIGAFNGADGYYPNSGLTLGTDGYLYGTTTGSAAIYQAYGTIYRISVNGDVLEVLYRIKVGDGMGAYPYAGLTQGSDGNFYGATAYGGSSTCSCGVLFRITPQGVPTVLHQFTNTDGGEPYAAPVQGPDGYYYGTTYSGGLYGLGTLYKMSSDGTLVTLHSFSGATGDGANPKAAVVLGSNPDIFYGTTAYGGTSNMGTVFSVTLAGATKVLHSFTGSATDGRTPVAPLILASNGNFYGTTLYGGGDGCSQVYAGCGTVYEISPRGKFTMRHVFLGGGDGEYPEGPVVQSIDGLLYGTTQNGGSFNTITCYNACGTVFRMRLNGALKTLDSFSSGDGWMPDSGLTLGPNLLLYGTTPTGDAGLGYGTIYALAPVNPPK